MKEEEINKRIAEVCGWKLEKHYWLTPEGCEAFTWDIPDYCNDLNAMHEAEKMLKEKQTHAYACELNEKVWYWGLIHATARQRAEAFLRTRRRWEEVQG